MESDVATPIRPGIEQEASAIASLVNRAYQVERFFVLGDRTSPDDVIAHMRKGVFLVAANRGEPPRGCVYVEADMETGSFGMLAVDPSHRGAGLGGRLINAAERHVRQAGARSMDIHVVNLRTELFPRYRRLGYVEIGTAPYVHRQTIQPCHFIVMRKQL